MLHLFEYLLNFSNIGYWAQSPIPNPQLTNNKIIYIYKLNKK